MKLKIRNKLTLEEISYLAGFLDGDGSIMAQIVKNSSYKYGHTVRVTICFYQKSKSRQSCKMYFYGLKNPPK